MLGGGGHLGACEAGTLRALLEAGIKPDLVLGTPVGAINGSVLAGSDDELFTWRGHRHPPPVRPGRTDPEYPSSAVQAAGRPLLHSPGPAWNRLASSAGGTRNPTKPPTGGKVRTMALHAVHRTGYTAARPGLEAGRLILTLLGAAALIVGAFLDWTRGKAATTITGRSLFQTDFANRTNIVKTVGGVAIVLGILAVIGLIDRTGWLSRLAGALGIVLFILFTVEVYRSDHHSLQAGAWLALAGGVVLVIGGMLTPRSAEELPTVIEERERIAAPDERRRDDEL